MHQLRKKHSPGSGYEEETRTCVATVVELCQLLSGPRTASTNPTEGWTMEMKKHLSATRKVSEGGIANPKAANLASTKLCASCQDTQRGFTEADYYGALSQTLNP